MKTSDVLLKLDRLQRLLHLLESPAGQDLRVVHSMLLEAVQLSTELLENEDGPPAPEASGATFELIDVRVVKLEPHERLRARLAAERVQKGSAGRG